MASSPTGRNTEDFTDLLSRFQRLIADNFRLVPRDTPRVVQTDFSEIERRVMAWITSQDPDKTP